MSTALQDHIRRSPVMDIEALPGFTDGVEYGRLMARVVEARRCLDILLSNEALERPIAAWDLIPLGLSAQATIVELRKKPTEAGILDLQCDAVKWLKERDRLAHEELATFEAKHAARN